MFNIAFPFTISVPLSLGFHFDSICSHPFPGPILTARGVLLTLAIGIVIIILVNYLIPIQWSNGQEVAWLVLSAAWLLNLCPQIIAPVLRKTLTGAFNLPQAGYMRIGGIVLIPEGMQVVPPPIVDLVMGCVKHLPHIWAEGNPPLPKRLTPAPAVLPHQLAVWKVVNYERIKKDYIIKEVPALWSLKPQTLYIRMSPRMYSKMNPVIWSQSNDKRRFITDVGMFALAFPIALLLPFGAIAVSWQWIYIQNLRIEDIVACSGKKPWGKLQSCVGYWVCFGMRGIILCKSHEVKIRMLSVCIIWEEKIMQV